MHRKLPIRLGALLAGVGLLSAACLQSQEQASGDSAQTKSGDGQVQILGAFPDPEASSFRDSLKEFEKRSGIEVTYTPSTDFTTEIRTRVQGGNPPDIALFPQPGLVMELASDGTVLPLNDLVNVGELKKTLVPGFLDSVTGSAGKVYASPIRMAVKSLVWYPKPEFAEAGYEVPKTWGELQDLAERIKADGGTPWCLGAEAGADTGWALTDWVEDMVLRTAGPKVYDKWYQHKIPFDSPKIQEAVRMLGQDILFDEGAVSGGTQAILTTPFDVSPNGMFEDPPECFLHRQGNFVTSFFPDDVQQNLAENVGVFVLPPVTSGYDGTPILGAGDMAAAFVNDSDVVKVLKFITSDEFGTEWAGDGGWLSPHKTFDVSAYPNDLTRHLAELVNQADVFRFDASDLMPAEVGAGTFWDNMVAWVGGQKDLDQALSAIEKSWPN